MRPPSPPNQPLAGVPLFAGLAPAALADLVQASRVRRYPRGPVLFSEGDPGDGLLILEEGTVRISRYTAAGQEVVLALVAAPAAFGELALIDGEPRSATVTATRPLTVRLLDRQAFLALLDREPTVERALLHTLAGMVRATNDRLTDLVALDVPGRLAKWLLTHMDTLPDSERGELVVSLALNQAELATELGTTRVSVNRALKTFEALQAISVERGRIVVHRRDLLLAHTG